MKHLHIKSLDAKMPLVRTTVTLDPDTRLLVERAMRERDLSFKEAVNEAIRAGLGQRLAPAKYTTPRALGPARLDVTKTLRLASDLEDDALTRRLAEGR
jgi:hypothetical protein